MLSLAIKIDSINGINVHIFSREGTGRHGNKYVKFKKGTLGAKFILDSGWETHNDFDMKTVKILEQWLEDNKEKVLHQIKELG